jgi:hypothetical protein
MIIARVVAGAAWTVVSLGFVTLTTDVYEAQVFAGESSS